MEEKGIDKNAIIGFVLIFAIMIGWFYINQPTPEEIEAQKALAAQSVTEEVISEKEFVTPPISESETTALTPKTIEETVDNAIKLAKLSPPDDNFISLAK
ncbi:MAG: hypothetical protein ACPGRT_03215, partial [Flavobacteriaceae bacterium]